MHLSLQWVNRFCFLLIDTLSLGLFVLGFDLRCNQMELQEMYFRYFSRIKDVEGLWKVNIVFREVFDYLSNVHNDKTMGSYQPKLISSISENDKNGGICHCNLKTSQKPKGCNFDRHPRWKILQFHGMERVPFSLLMIVVSYILLGKIIDSSGGWS